MTVVILTLILRNLTVISLSFIPLFLFPSTPLRFSPYLCKLLRRTKIVRTYSRSVKSSSMAVPDSNAMIDQTYEFSAPRFFDFINGETEEDVQKAEHWFETALSYAPSPFMPRIKTGRSESIQIESLCDFSNADNQQKTGGSSQTDEKTLTAEENSTRLQAETVTAETRKEEEIHPPQQENRTNPSTVVEITKKIDEDKDGVCTQEKERSISTGQVPVVVETGTATVESIVSVPTGSEVCCTPIPQMVSRKEELPTNSKKTQTAKRIASLVRNPSALKTRNQSQLSQAKGVQPTSQSQLTQVKGIKPSSQSQLSHVKGVKPTSARSAKTVKNTMSTSEFVQENQAIKRQKLDEGRSRQILNIRLQPLPHKSRPGSSSFSNLCSSTIKTRKEDRKVYSREQAAATPFVSTAELVKRFQSNTRDVGLHLSKSSLSHDDATSIMQRKSKLTLTRPVEPAFETSQRVRSVRAKSSAELEEEMMANIPKFKARPLNKKMLEAPTLPALPRSTPQLPEFQEFHLKTMERANQHAETSTVVSTTESSHQNQWNPHKLTEPKTPRLETSLRARPTKVKTTDELEQEELEKIPKFKARPLNKKIFESKGDLGIYCNSKRQVTKPQEFHFATDDRIPPTRSVFDMFDKLSLNSEPHHDHQLPRLTHPNPFHLQTEERGAEKERRFVVEVLQKQLEEEKARIPKATPYPYTTDYPVVPPKPEPKQCTKPEPFQLESLTRHEEELQRELEERQRMEREAAQMRIFKAQPILKEDPLPVPEKERKPLTEVQEFSLHVDHRAVDRAEFDKKIKEKEMMYKRYRDEFESAKQMEDEKALKQMRRTMVPHARPVPNFDHPFHPQKSSKETTKAKSPNLRVIRRKEKRRMTTGVEAATSAAASQMR